jgi:hypothetical protein
MSEQLASCRSHLDAGGQDAQAFLLSNAQDLCQAQGDNHWRAVLLEALAATGDLQSLL